MKQLRAATVVALTLTLTSTFACQSLSPNEATPYGPDAPPVVADLPVARAPFDDVQVDWKQRIDQPYVYLEATGSYTGIGRLLERLFDQARAQQLKASGPPFALYYDDPGRVAAERLRMRACLPVDRVVSPQTPLRYEVLESTTVAYAFIGGPYPEVPRAYPALFAFLKRLDWVEHGPIREIYLQDPTTVGDWSALVTEVQIPATAAR